MGTNNEPATTSGPVSRPGPKVGPGKAIRRCAACPGPTPDCASPCLAPSGSNGPGFLPRRLPQICIKAAFGRADEALALRLLAPSPCPPTLPPSPRPHQRRRPGLALACALHDRPACAGAGAGGEAKPCRAASTTAADRASRTARGACWSNSACGRASLRSRRSGAPPAVGRLARAAAV